VKVHCHAERACQQFGLPTLFGREASQWFVIDTPRAPSCAPAPPRATRARGRHWPSLKVTLSIVTLAHWAAAHSANVPDPASRGFRDRGTSKPALPPPPRAKTCPERSRRAYHCSCQRSASRAVSCASPALDSFALGVTKLPRARAVREGPQCRSPDARSSTVFASKERSADSPRYAKIHFRHHRDSWGIA